MESLYTEQIHTLQHHIYREKAEQDKKTTIEGDGKEEKNGQRCRIDNTKCEVFGYAFRSWFVIDQRPKCPSNVENAIDITKWTFSDVALFIHKSNSDNKRE